MNNQVWIIRVNIWIFFADCVSLWSFYNGHNCWVAKVTLFQWSDYYTQTAVHSHRKLCLESNCDLYKTFPAISNALSLSCVDAFTMHNDCFLIHNISFFIHFFPALERRNSVSRMLMFYANDNECPLASHPISCLSFVICYLNCSWSITVRYAGKLPWLET
jgi:hypothetical protein